MTNNYLATTKEITGVSNGKKSEFRELYTSYYKDLYYYGLKLSGSEDLTKDCMQDLFLQFWSNKDAFKEVRSVKAYILKCFRRRIIAQLADGKKKYEKKEYSDFWKERNLISESIENEWIENETQNIMLNRLLKAKQYLTTRQQEILYLKFNLGYDYDTICDIMEIKYQSVRNLLSEAVKLLRDKMEIKN